MEESCRWSEMEVFWDLNSVSDSGSTTYSSLIEINGYLVVPGLQVRTLVGWTSHLSVAPFVQRPMDYYVLGLLDL